MLSHSILAKTSKKKIHNNSPLWLSWDIFLILLVFILYLAFIIFTCIHQRISQSQQHIVLEWEHKNEKPKKKKNIMLNISGFVTRQPNRTEANRQSHLVCDVILSLSVIWICVFLFNSPVQFKANKMKLINWTYLLPLSYFISTCCWPHVLLLCVVVVIVIIVVHRLTDGLNQPILNKYVK